MFVGLVLQVRLLPYLTFDVVRSLGLDAAETRRVAERLEAVLRPVTEYP